MPKDFYFKHLQKLASRWDNLLGEEVLSNKKYYELYDRSKEILKQLCPDDHDFLDKVATPSRENIERLIGKLRAVQFDLNDGILSPEIQIQNKITIDLMQQAEALLLESKPGAYQHIPAAILAGAILEHFFRTLCERQLPPIPLKLEGGSYKTLGTLVNDLEKNGLYNATETQQLKVWVKIRNSAAHGHFDEFTYEQVVGMISDVKRFIDNHK